MTTWLNVKNNAESALASAITAAATTITLVSGEGSRFPSSNFNISIDDEILTCSSRSGDVLTVTRAQEGTAAAAHAAGAIVALNVTAAVITQLQTAVDAGVGDMLKSVYDTNLNNIVDNSEKLEGSTKLQVQDHAPKAHATTHQNGGADEISIAGLAGESAELATHKNLTTGVHGAGSNTIAHTGLIREKLTANRTYYVRTDGSDSNTGLVNSAAGAFLTIQKAIDAAAALDCSIYDITIQLGAGTYVVTSIIKLKSIVGSGSVTIIGDETTPTNVVINGQGISALFEAISVPYTAYKLKGFKLYSSTANVTFGIHSNGSYIEFQNLNFGAGFTHQLRTNDFGRITCTGNYTISGGAACHLVGVAGVLRVSGKTITITGTPNFSNSYIALEECSSAIAHGCTFSGLATGKRYNITMNSVCLVGGAGVDYFPGNVAGTTATGGQYT